MSIGNHKKKIQMFIIKMAYDVILGQPWMEEHHLWNRALLINIVNKTLILDECKCRQGRLAAVEMEQTLEQMVPKEYYRYKNLFVKKLGPDALPKHQP